MSYYNSYIECQNAWRLLGLSETQHDELINFDKGWNPEFIQGDLSYHSSIFNTTYRRASWGTTYSPMINVTKDDIDRMVNDASAYMEYDFVNNTAIRFRITAPDNASRLKFQWWLVDLVGGYTIGSSTTLICTRGEVGSASFHRQFYVMPYFSKMIDTVNDPGWDFKDFGLAFCDDECLAYLITQSPVEGVRIDDGLYIWGPNLEFYGFYEIIQIASENSWNNIPDWFWDGNQADVSVDYPGEDDEDDYGGYGDGEEWDDEVPFADIPTISALGTELVNIYTPDVSEIQAFNTWLWTSSYEQNVKKLQASPMDNIITFGFIPLSVTSVTDTIKIGGIDTAISSKAASTQYITVDCGTVHVGKYYDSFLDYDSEYQIYLPFIGYKPLRADDITGADINVQYLVDILTGTCYAQVEIEKYDELQDKTLSNVIYSYVGNCFIELPISGANYARMKQGQMSSIVHGATSLMGNVFKGAGTGMAAGGAAGALAGGLLGAATSIPSLIDAKQNYDIQRPDYEHGGGLSGNAIFCYKKPFIIRTKMIRKVPDHYKALKGIPSSRFKYLKDLQGFTKINAVVVDTLSGLTSQEKSEIVQLLQEGVII